MDDRPAESDQTQRRLEITEADLERSSAPAPTPPLAPHATAPASAHPAMPVQPGAPDGHWTEATRLMCTAAYLESTFAQDVVDEVLHEHHRAVHIPTGIDIDPVAKHCLAAVRQKIARDVLLTADLLLSITLFLTKASFAWLFYGFLLAWAILLWDSWSATYLVVKRLNPFSFSSYPPPAPTDARMARRIEALARDQRGNLTAYSGFLPFSGAGSNVGGWSFLIDLRKGGEDLFGERSAPEEPTLQELYDGIERSLAELEMSNLEIKDRLFVSGSDLREDRGLLPNPLGPPVSSVNPSVVRQFMLSPSHRIRHYRCIEIIDWRGELVVSLFLRFSIRNGRLFCELNKFVLLPLNEELHRLNRLGGGIRPRDVLFMCARSLVATPGLSFRAPRVITRPLARSFAMASTAKDVERDPFFDFGASVTALDRVRSTRYRRYFQRLDKEMYDKILERTVLDSVAQILDQHGIDTAEIAERSSNIINNGIMMNKGTITADNLAVGRGSGIHINMPRLGSRSGDPPPPRQQA